MFALLVIIIKLCCTCSCCWAASQQGQSGNNFVTPPFIFPSHVETSTAQCCEVTVVAVLGLILGPDGVPSELLRERCILGAKVAKERPEAIVIPTGGDTAGVGVTEAAVMEKFLIEYRVGSQRIQLEDQALDTPSNAINVLGMGRDLSGCGRVRLMLITSSYHMPRSVWTFKVVAKAMRIDLVLEQHTAPWVGGRGEEISKLEKELRFLLKSQRLMKKVGNGFWGYGGRLFSKLANQQAGEMEDIGTATKEVQELIKDAVIDITM